MTARTESAAAGSTLFRRGLLGYLPANLVQGGVGLLALICFTRLLTPAQYGAYALAFSATSLVHTIVFVWLESAMARFLAPQAAAGREPAHLATIYRLWLLLAGPYALLASVAVVLLPAPADLKAALAAGLAAILARSLCKLAQERRRAAGDVQGAAALDMVQTAGGFLIALVLILIGWAGAGVFAGAGAVAAACLVLVLPTELRRMGKGRLDADLAREFVAYGLPVSATLILALALATVDRFLIAAWLGDSAVGVYQAGYTLANRSLDVIFIWLGMASGPAMIAALAHGGRPALSQAAGAQGSVFISLTLPAAVGLAIVARPLAEVMIGPALRDGAAEVTPWIAASGFFSGFTAYYLNMAFILGRRTSLMLVAMAIPAVANIALNLVLIPRFGLHGAMWAATGAYGLGAAVSIVLGRRALPLPLPLRDLARAGTACLIMALIVGAMPAIGGAAELAAKAAAGVVIYAALAVVFDVAQTRARVAGILALAAERVFA